MYRLTEQSNLHYGKAFRGQPLGKVPASYLLWVYGNCVNIPANLKLYIEEKMEQLKKEAKRDKKARYK